MGLGAPSYTLMRIGGIRIGVDASWFLILFLAIFFLQDVFKTEVAGSDTTAYIAAVATTLLFFASIAFHELGHAFATKREGMHVIGIQLHFFGGYTSSSTDTQSPGAEFRVTAAGPLATLLIAVVGGLIGSAVWGDEFWDATLEQITVPVGAALMVLAWVVKINALLFVFNLLPALPLDGGRLARAGVWKATGDRAKATRITAALGQLLGWGLIALGLYFVFALQDTFSGIYTALLGWLITQAARGAVVQSAMTQRLEGVTVADLMDTEPVTIPAEMRAGQAFEEFFLRYHGWDWFAVVDADGRYLGRVERNAVQAAADDDVTVADVTPSDAEGRVRDDATLEALLGSEPLRRLGSLMAVDAEGRLRGVVTFEQVTRALRSRLATG